MSFESIEHNDSSAEKERQWSEIEQEVDRIRDRLGHPVDEGIKTTVVALQANGFSTTSSCEGHPDWGRGYPYVLIESPLAESLDRDGRYSELQEKARRAQKGGEPLTAEERGDARKLFLARIEANDEECKRLAKVLAQFYGLTAERAREHPVRLGIEKGPWNQSWIVPEGVRHIGRPVHESDVDSKSRAMKVRALTLYRGEMERFTEFLREQFFRG